MNTETISNKESGIDNNVSDLDQALEAAINDCNKMEIREIIALTKQSGR